MADCDLEAYITIQALIAAYARMSPTIGDCLITRSATTSIQHVRLRLLHCAPALVQTLCEIMALAPDYRLIKSACSFCDTLMALYSYRDLNPSSLGNAQPHSTAANKVWQMGLLQVAPAIRWVHKYCKAAPAQPFGAFRDKDFWRYATQQISRPGASMMSSGRRYRATTVL